MLKLTGTDSLQQRSKEQDEKIRKRAAKGDFKAKSLLEQTENNQGDYKIVNLDEDKERQIASNP